VPGLRIKTILLLGLLTVAFDLFCPRIYGVSRGKPPLYGERGEEKLPQGTLAGKEEEFRKSDKRVVVGRVQQVVDNRAKLNLGLDFNIKEGDSLEIYRRIIVVESVSGNKVRLTWKVGRVVVLESAGFSSIGEFYPDDGEEIRVGDEIRAVVSERVLEAGIGGKR